MLNEYLHYFSFCLQKHLLNKLKDGLREDINLREIKWVITVPAIWRNSAKQFMREAASRVGEAISRNNENMIITKCYK